MATSPTVRPDTRRAPKTRTLPPYHVVLLNDDDHSVDYVVRMLNDLFGHPPAKGVEIAREVHFRGRAVVATTNLEQAELKCEQIQSFGPDPLIERCKGSMSATVEPASG
jgi:ATP-dependent Clp protease adaptor protein ClpS